MNIWSAKFSSTLQICHISGSEKLTMTWVTEAEVASLVSSVLWFRSWIAVGTKVGVQGSSVITWELLRNVESQESSQTYGVKVYIVTRSLGESVNKVEKHCCRQVFSKPFKLWPVIGNTHIRTYNWSRV